MNEFTPMVIGLPDTKKEQQIIDVYSSMCFMASSLVSHLQFYFDSPHFEIKEFFYFLKSKDPKAWLYSKYIEYHGLTFPGMDVDKVIKFELVSIPENYLQDTMSLRDKVLSYVSKANELKFFFPLRKLFYESNEDDCRDFMIEQLYPGGVIPSNEFYIALYNHIRKFTKSEKENEILNAFENLKNDLNGLVRLGVIRNDRQRWNIDVEDIIYSIVFNLNSENPLSINPKMPNFKGFRRFFEVRNSLNITGRPGDILKVEEPDPAQLEELPENILPPDDFKEEPVSGDPETELTKIQPKEVLQTE